MIPATRDANALDGQVAIVTGGGSGIGRAVCLALAREGARVVVVSRTPEAVARTVAAVHEIAGQECALGLCLDVSREADMENMARQTLDRHGCIDILVACAGVGRGSLSRGRMLPPTVAEMSLTEWEEVMNINLKGVFLSNRAALPAMIRQQHGFIINISSGRAGRYGIPFTSAYCATKFGIAGFTESLMEEVAPYGVRALALFPDVTDTPMLAEASLNRGSLLSPEQVASLILKMLTLPSDTHWRHPVIAPLHNQGQPSWVARHTVSQAPKSP